MTVNLLLIRGVPKARKIPLRAKKTTVGRAKSCTLTIPSTSVSRQHCVFEHSGSGVLLKDLGSANGTFVNGEKVVEAQLQAGDQVVIGPITFIVQLNGVPQWQEDGATAANARQATGKWRAASQMSPKPHASPTQRQEQRPPPAPSARRSSGSDAPPEGAGEQSVARPRKEPPAARVRRSADSGKPGAAAARQNTERQRRQRPADVQAQHAEHQRREAAARQRTEAEARRQAAEKQRRKEETVRKKAEQERRQREDRARRQEFVRRLKSHMEAEQPAAHPKSDEFQQQLADRLASRRQAFRAWRDAEPSARSERLDLLEEEELRRWRLERKFLGLQGDDGSSSAPFQRKRLGPKLSDFLLTPLEIGYHGRHLATAVSLLNPFRLAGHSATFPQDQLPHAVRQSRQAVQRGAAPRFPIDVGLETVVPSRRLTRHVRASAWQTPSARLLAELFWLHLADDSLQLLVREIGDITNDLTFHYLQHELQFADEQSAILIRHAMSVSWLNVAIAREAAFAAGQLTNAVAYWDVALAHWSNLMTQSSFWDYLHDRGHGSLVDRAREVVPFILGGVLGRFACAYGRRGDEVSCHRMLSCLRRSEMPEEVRDGGPLAAVRGAFY